MKKSLYTFITVIATISITLGQERQSIPDWFQEGMKSYVGTWITDNSQYKSENEPFDQYGIAWEWGIGEKSIKGKLFGLIDGKKSGTFWEFRQYWDFAKNEGVLVQYDANGTVGIGSIKSTGEGKTESLQIFTTPAGNSTPQGHRSSVSKDAFTSTSYDIGKSNEWNASRSYTWGKQIVQKASLDLGVFSISLAVKDIAASKTFYEKLGFSQTDGAVSQKWLIMKNGNRKIGLFQGIFPTNTMTFNPKDARTISNKLGELGIKPVFSTGLDKESGACSFSITDPDGNPILIDQH